jgi:hypothetical protein
MKGAQQRKAKNSKKNLLHCQISRQMMGSDAPRQGGGYNPGPLPDEVAR